MGQDKDTSFRQLYFSFVNQFSTASSISEHWDAPYLTSIFFGTNYKGGQIHLGFHNALLKGKHNLPDMVILCTTAGYDLIKPIGKRVQLGASFSIGNALMRFDDANAPENLRNESEMVVFVSPQLTYPITPMVHVGAVYNWNRIFTQPRLDMQWVGFHISCYFVNPKKVAQWLE